MNESNCSTCEKSSAVIIQGMEPGPTEKNMTKKRVLITEMYFIQAIISCGWGRGHPMGSKEYS